MSSVTYLLRHGRTPWNAEGRLQGQSETDLDALGSRQATENGHRLAALIDDPSAFDFVASPMRRTRQTMELARAAMDLDPLAYRTDSRLIEVGFGDWEGYTFQELDAARPGATAPRSRDKWNFLPPGAGAESYQMMAERVQPWLEAIDRPTVCVTHGGVICALFRLIENLPEKRAAKMEVHQDRILRYADGRLEWL